MLLRDSKTCVIPPVTGVKVMYHISVIPGAPHCMDGGQVNENNRRLEDHGYELEKKRVVSERQRMIDEVFPQPPRLQALQSSSTRTA